MSPIEGQPPARRVEMEPGKVTVESAAVQPMPTDTTAARGKDAAERAAGRYNEPEPERAERPETD